MRQRRRQVCSLARRPGSSESLRLPGCPRALQKGVYHWNTAFAKYNKQRRVGSSSSRSVD